MRLDLHIYLVFFFVFFFLLVTTKQTSATEDVESQEDIPENIIFLFSVLGFWAWSPLFNPLMGHLPSML